MYKGDDMKSSFSGVADETQQSIFDSFQSFGSLNDHTIQESFGMELESTFEEKDESIPVDHCFSSMEESHAEINTEELIPEQTFLSSRSQSPAESSKLIPEQTFLSSRSQSPAESSINTVENDLSRNHDEDAGMGKHGGKPKRPLSAYNLYFQLERERLIDGTADTEFTAEEVERVAAARRHVGGSDDKPKRKHRKSHGKISFAELARTIANKWKTLQPSQKDLLLERAAMEKARYLRELEEWTKMKNAEFGNSMTNTSFLSMGESCGFMKDTNFPAIVTPTSQGRSLVEMMSVGYGVPQLNSRVTSCNGQEFIRDDRMMNLQRQFIAREILAMEDMLPSSPRDVRFNNMDSVEMSNACDFGNYNMNCNNGMNTMHGTSHMYESVPYGCETKDFMAPSAKQSMSFDYLRSNSMNQESQFLDECQTQVFPMYQGQQQQYSLEQGSMIHRRFTFPSYRRTCPPMPMSHQQSDFSLGTQQDLFTSCEGNMMSSIPARFEDEYVQ
jgi:hypothetical protein